MMGLEGCWRRSRSSSEYHHNLWLDQETLAWYHDIRDEEN